MFKKLCLASIVTFILLACSDESDIINGQVDSISQDDIIGIWTLFEVKYPKGDSLIVRYPEEDTISITFKFWKDRTGQMLHFEKGSTDIENFKWYVSGSFIEFVWENGDVEYISCHLADEKLCLKYSFTIPNGEIVQATYLFVKQD